MLQQLVNFLFALIFYKVQLFTDYKKINSQYSLSFLLLFHETDTILSWFDLIDFWCFNATFSNIMVTSFSGGRSQSTRREPPTMGKQLINFITCGCETSAPFFVIYKAGREPTPYWW